MGRYRAHFRPNGELAAPHAILTVAVVCAETTAEAERLAASADYGHVRRARGEFGPLVSPEEALAYAWTAEEEVLRRANRQRLFVGDPSQVRERLTAMAQSLGADEIMVMSAIFDPVARMRSFELMATAFELQPPG